MSSTSSLEQQQLGLDWADGFVVRRHRLVGYQVYNWDFRRIPYLGHAYTGIL